MSKRSVVKISCLLPQDDYELLKRLSVEQSISMTDVLRRALKTDDWLRQVVRRGDRIIIMDKEGREREAILLD